MFGVVLWCDSQKNCAVIWCEDHRNLAYFTGDPEMPLNEPSLSRGDLVEFAVREHDDLRFAICPSIVAERFYPYLAEDLLRASAATDAEQPNVVSIPSGVTEMSNVVAFPTSSTSESLDATRGTRVG